MTRPFSGKRRLPLSKCFSDMWLSLPSMPPTKYIETISKPSSWGGAIELAILAAHYGTEIASIDVETGRIDHFTPPDHESLKTSMITNRCIVIYSGIHYDAASLAPSPDAPAEWHQTLFEIVRKCFQPFLNFKESLIILFLFKAIVGWFGSHSCRCKETRGRTSV